MKNALKSIGWILIYLITYMAFQLGYSVVSSLIFGFRANILTENQELDSVMESFISSQVPNTIIFAGAASLVFYYIMVTIRDKDFSKECRLHPISWNHGIASGLLGISGLAISSLLLAALAYFLDTAYMDHMENMNLILGGNKILVFISIGIVAPIIEEILFRGLIFKELERNMKVKTVIVVQALLFGIYHFNIAQGVYTTFLGILLGISLIWTGSLWAPIIIHIVNNSVSYLFSLAGNENTVFLTIAGFTLMAGIIIFPLIMRYLYKTRVDKALLKE